MQAGQQSYMLAVVSRSFPTYSPGKLLDALARLYIVRNDKQLGEVLALDRGTISKIRSKSIPLSSSMILRIHEASGMAVAEIRQLAGLPIPTYKAPPTRENA